MLTRKQISEWGHNAGEYKDAAETLVEWLELWVKMSYLQWTGTRDELKEQLGTKLAVEAFLGGDGET